MLPNIYTTIIKIEKIIDSSITPLHLITCKNLIDNFKIIFPQKKQIYENLDILLQSKLLNYEQN